MTSNRKGSLRDLADAGGAQRRAEEKAAQHLVALQQYVGDDAGLVCDPDQLIGESRGRVDRHRRLG